MHKSAASNADGAFASSSVRTIERRSNGDPSERHFGLLPCVTLIQQNDTLVLSRDE